MSLPDPETGMMIHYSYLWARHAERQAGEKDRPAVILSVTDEENGDLTVRVAPVTHTPPLNPADGIKIPDDTKKRLGLDKRDMWLMVSEVNEFVWPGIDLNRVPNKVPRTYFYGHVPAKLLHEARVKMRGYDFKNELKLVPRDGLQKKNF